MSSDPRIALELDDAPPPDGWPLTDDELRSSAEVPDMRHVVAAILRRPVSSRSAPLTNAEAVTFARVIADLAGPDVQALPVVQLSKALLRYAAFLDRLTLSGSQTETLCLFAANPRAAETYPRTVAVIADILRAWRALPESQRSNLEGEQ